jgi:transposase
VSAAPPIALVELPPEQVQALLERIRSVVTAADFEIIAVVMNTVPQLLALLARQDMSLARLRRMLLGSQSEKTAHVLPGSSAATAGDSSGESSAKSPPQKRRSGHGRNGTPDYPGARRVPVPHPQLHPGDSCLACGQGKVYRLRQPSRILFLIAQPAFPATLYELEQFRCARCGQVFTAPPPPEVGAGKYDESVGCQLAVLRYGAGLPMTRIAEWQQNVGVPLPVGTQWDLLKQTAQAIAPVGAELQRLAAQSPLLHTDDTYMRVLALRKENPPPPDPEDPKADRQRTGVFTTGIVARTGEHDIALFVTGRQYAGENLRDLLRQRAPELPAPILMSDALSRNVPKEFEIILANCNCHARRNFIEIVEPFPAECRQVLESFRQIYHFDAQAKEQGLSPQARLEFHQIHSGPVLEQLHTWIQTQGDTHQVEPNSRLGKAFKYLLKHWQPLTLFLRQPGAPLDNNICEQMLKKAIRHRKNSLFYKTLLGAWIGDLFMSVIFTCQSCRTNAFEYLTALARHPQAVRDHPGQWLPWNYQTARAQLNSS